jgi:hypothetical protein
MVRFALDTYGGIGDSARAAIRHLARRYDEIHHMTSATAVTLLFRKISACVAYQAGSKLWSA